MLLHYNESMYCYFCLPLVILVYVFVCYESNTLIKDKSVILIYIHVDDLKLQSVTNLTTTSINKIKPIHLDIVTTYGYRMPLYLPTFFKIERDTNKLIVNTRINFCICAKRAFRLRKTYQ